MAPEQRFVFDEVAELYERVRPSYPEALVDDVIALSGIAPGGRILEIGSGTGLATEPFARRGFRLVGLEPGAAMRAVAQRKLARFGEVRLEPTTFGDWPLEAGSFDLVIAAQSFHWVEPELRFTKTAAALRRGGALAVFGNLPLDDITPLRAELDRAYARHAPALLIPMGQGYSELERIMKSLDSSAFGAVEVRRHPWSSSYTPDEYIDLMRTHSPHRMLPEAQRNALHGALREVIERHGGRIEVRCEAELHLARRL